MFIFFLLALTFAQTTPSTYTIGGKGEIVIQIDKQQLEEKLINKCVDADIFRFTITKDGNAYKFNFFKTTDCTGSPLATVDMTEMTKELPKLQEEITIEGEFKIVIGFPYGCLLSMIPEFSKDAKKEFNLGFIHTQFGADIHSYSEGECQGKDIIQEIFRNGTQLIENKITMYLQEQNITLEKVKDIAQGAINMFEVIKKEAYEYIEKLPSLVDEYIYEFNGTVMKIYKKVEDLINGKKQEYIEYVQDAIIPVFENVIGKLVDESGKIFNITADCDDSTGISFGFYGDKLQQTVSGKGNCKFDINGFNLNFRLNISSVLGKDKSMWIDNVKYYYQEVSNYAKELETATTAIVESFGSNLEFDLNTCKPIKFENVLATFSDLVLSTFDNYPTIQKVLKEMIEKAEDIHAEVKKIIQEIQKLFPWYKIPTYGYKIGMLKTGTEGKNYATYSFYQDGNCTADPLFEFVIGVVVDTKVENVETGFTLTKYLDNTDCSSKKGEDGYYKEHVQVDVCVNGFKYVHENGELKQVSCENLKKANRDVDTTHYTCDTCVECLKKQGVVQGDYAYVKCGSSAMVMLLIAFLFVILF